MNRTSFISLKLQLKTKRRKSLKKELILVPIHKQFCLQLFCLYKFSKKLIELVFYVLLHFECKNNIDH